MRARSIGPATSAWALVSCAAAANVQGGKLSQPRVVLGAIANIPYQVPGANQFLEGKSLDESTLNQAADLLLQKAQPHSENGYKIPIARALIRRTLLQLNA